MLSKKTQKKKIVLKRKTPKKKKEIMGINFEGNKINIHAINHGAEFAVNLQIAMDAPFDGDVANHEFRNKGPSESRFAGYKENEMQNKIKYMFNYVTKKCLKKNINTVVLQIARGRSGRAFFNKNVKQFLSEKIKYIIFYGYRSNKYFKLEKKINFAFINIGMFARFTKSVRPGEVFVCKNGISIKHDKEKNIIILPKSKINNRKIIVAGFPLVKLIGISDSMPFVTPENYNKKELISLFNK